MTTTINGEQIDLRVALTNTYFRCTHCRRIRPAKAFGFRRMTGTSLVRNQAQCTDCRNENKPRATKAVRHG